MKRFISSISLLTLSLSTISSVNAAELKWQDYELRGYMATQSRQIEAVELALTNSLEKLNASGKASDVMVLSLLEKLINVSASQGKFGAALEYSKLALRFAERINDKERTGILYASQGNVLMHDGKFTQAELSYDKALNLLSVDNKQRPAVLHGLARVKATEGKLHAAEELFKQAFEAEKTLGLAASPAELTRYAEFWKNAGNSDKAIALIQQALKIDEAELSADHPVLSAELNNLAVLQAGKGELAESEKNMQRAVALGQRYRFQDLNDWLGNLKTILEQCNKTKEAESLQQEIEKTARPVKSTVTRFTNPLLNTKSASK